jgi:hypothetical protein
VPRPEQESNTINRVLKARGLPSLDQPEVLPRLGYLVENHGHFTELLKACEPALRREMYEAISPHLRFRAKSLEEYISAGKQHAEAAQLPTIEPDGTLKEFAVPVIEDLIEDPTVTLWVTCTKCGKEGFFYGERLADAVHTMRSSAGWAYDEGGNYHLCPECLDAMD